MKAACGGKAIGALARLKTHRTERLEPALARNGGRLVKPTGDGALPEFSSAADALSAAIEFQQLMDEVNRGELDDMAIVFRIGLHLGDLIVDGEDLYGDGVNVAARLEGEARPGGVVISGNEYDAVAGRLMAIFEDLAPLALKNIERPVQAFRAKWKSEDWQTAIFSASVAVAVQSADELPFPIKNRPSQTPRRLESKLASPQPRASHHPA